MIGWVQDQLVEKILDPQAAPELGERRVLVDARAEPIDSHPQEFDVLDGTTRPVSYEIGGGIEFAHTIAVGLDVQHGEVLEARRIRDLILVDLVLRIRDAELNGETDPVTGQTWEGLRWSIDYRPHGFSDTNESATITFTVSTRLGG